MPPPITFAVRLSGNENAPPEYEADGAPSEDICLSWRTRRETPATGRIAESTKASQWRRDHSESSWPVGLPPVQPK